LFALVVRFEVKAGSVAAFDRLTTETLRGIREDETGTLLYVTCAVGDDANSRVFLEIYRDEMAFREHEARPHTRRFLAEREPLIDSFRVEFLSPLDGKFPT
jgi:quinol monooxygenase YgiN